MYKPWYKHRYESGLSTECEMKRELITPSPSRSSLILFTALWAVQAYGQTTAAIRGAVTDAAKPVVAKALVKAVKTETGFAAKAKSGTHSNYTRTPLPIGMYRLSVEASGLRRVELANVKFANQRVAGINVRPQIGTVSEWFEVTGGAPLVNRQTTEVGQLIEGRSIVELPLNGRNPQQLATLATGVSGENVHTVLVGNDDLDAGRCAASSLPPTSAGAALCASERLFGSARGVPGDRSPYREWIESSMTVPVTTNDEK